MTAISPQPRSERFLARILAVLGAALAIGQAAPLSAQTDVAPAVDTPPSPSSAAAPAPQTGTTAGLDEEATRLEALTGRLAEAEAELAAARAAARAASPSAAAGAERIQRLEALVGTLGRAIEHRQSLDAAASRAPVPVPEEVSIASLIWLQEEQRENRRRLEELGKARSADRTAVEKATEQWRAAERTRREARDAYEERSSPEREVRLAQARLESRLAREQLLLRQLELRDDRNVLARAEKRATELSEQIASMKASLAAADQDRNVTDPELVAREGELARRRDAAQRDLASAELRLNSALGRYQAQTDPPPVLLEEIESLRLERDAKVGEVSLLEGQLARTRSEQALQQRWLATLRGEASREELGDWDGNAREAAAEYDRMAIQRQGRISELQERLAALRSRLAAPDLDPRIRRELIQRRDLLQGQIARAVADASDLERHAALQNGFTETIREAMGSMPIRERLRALGGVIRDFWNYEISTVDDEAITVGNAMLALILIGLGFTVSQRVSQAIRRLIENRFQLEPGVAGAMQTAAFYVLLVSFILVALRTINFPLTAFTVAGGALAIGIGFGSQNVMNNFISGLILMLERPVRAQDLVELESTHGQIEQIGARSTRIRATDGRHIIVPNSFFLENNVVNWTLSDDLIRTKVTVGVIYGSPTRLVRQLIQQSLDENERILRQPAPIIIFHEFGDNSLNFDAYFWLHARGPMQVNQVSSEVRFRIDDLFREHDLVIAFPQRDVHLDSVSPIEVRMVGDAPATDADDDRGERS